jgi:hypothetical protein
MVRILQNKSNFIRRRAMILFLLVALSAYFLSNRSSIKNPDPNIQDKVGAGLTKCSNDSQKILDYGCVRSEFELLVGKNSLSSIIASLEELFVKEKSEHAYGTMTCHGPSHVIGELAVQDGISFSEIMNQCSTKCDYGCLHGAFVQMFKLDQDFLDNFPAVCDEYKTTSIPKEMNSCQHIVGHGLAEIFGNDVDKTLRHCERFSSDAGRRNCGRGAVMQVLLGSPDMSASVDIAEEGIIPFCNRIFTPYIHDCLDNAGFYAYNLFDEHSAVETCNSIPPEYQENCIYSYGSFVYFRYRQAPEKVLESCKKFGKKFLDMCIKGALEINVGEKPYLLYGIKICHLVKDTFPGCFAFYRQKLEWGWGKDYGKEICPSLPAEEQKYCLGE